MSRTHSGAMTRHVMFVISGLERGGAENQLVGTAAALSSRGWNVTVLSFLPLSTNSWATELENTGVNLLTLNASSGLRKYYSFVDAVRHIRRPQPRHLGWFHVSRHHDGSDSRPTNRRPRSRLLCPQRTRRLISRADNARDGRFNLRRNGSLPTTGLRPCLQTYRANLSDVMSFPTPSTFARFHAQNCRNRTRKELGVSENQFLWLAAGRLDEAKDYPNTC